MAAIISVQFNCDDCGKVRQERGAFSRSQVVLNALLEAGWSVRGEKVFCPECQVPQVAGSWQKKIGAGR